ncbi:uncharacterized protein, partial [Diadema antillarum]|uniref:uncharacterized protein n=1 Tax=Diadema antillarum TaxID=105358 RepID=UPI003A83D55C
FPSSENLDEDNVVAFPAVSAMRTLCRGLSYPLLRLTGIDLCRFIPDIPEFEVNIEQGSTVTMELIESTTPRAPVEVVATLLPTEVTAEELYERTRDACDRSSREFDDIIVYNFCFIIEGAYTSRDFGLYLLDGQLLVGYAAPSARRVTFPEFVEAVCMGEVPSVLSIEEVPANICDVALNGEIGDGSGSGDGEAGSGDGEDGSGEGGSGSGDDDCGSTSDTDSSSDTGSSSDTESYYRSYPWSMSDDYIYF